MSLDASVKTCRAALLFAINASVTTYPSVHAQLTVRDEHWQRSDQSPLPSSAGGRQFSPWRPAVPLEGASTAQATSADSASAGARTPTVTTAAGHDGAAATVLAEPAGEARQGSSAVAEAAAPRPSSASSRFECFM